MEHDCFVGGSFFPGQMKIDKDFAFQQQLDRFVASETFHLSDIDGCPHLFDEFLLEEVQIYAGVVVDEYEIYFCSGGQFVFLLEKNLFDGGRQDVQSFDQVGVVDKISG